MSILIGIDASRANKIKKTGTEWYSYHLIQELKKIAPQYRDAGFILYSAEPLRGDLGILPRNWESRVLAWSPKRFWTQIRLSWEMWRRPPDILFIPAHTIPIIHPKKVVTTVHDLGFINFPKAYGWLEKIYHKFALNFAVKNATKIITVSEFTKNELIKYTKIIPEKVAVVYNSHDSERYKIISDKSAVEKVLGFSAYAQEPITQPGLPAGVGIPKPSYFLPDNPFYFTKSFIEGVQTFEDACRFVKEEFEKDEADRRFKVTDDNPYEGIRIPGFGDVVIKYEADMEYELVSPILTHRDIGTMLGMINVLADAGYEGTVTGHQVGLHIHAEVPLKEDGEFSCGPIFRAMKEFFGNSNEIAAGISPDRIRRTFISPLTPAFNQFVMSGQVKDPTDRLQILALYSEWVRQHPEKYTELKWRIIDLLNETYNTSFCLSHWLESKDDEVSYFLNEAGSNTLQHAEFQAPNKFHLWLGKKGFIISIEQQGKGFDAQEVEKNNIQKNAGAAFDFFRRCESAIFFDDPAQATKVFFQYRFR